MFSEEELEKALRESTDDQIETCNRNSMNPFFSFACLIGAFAIGFIHYPWIAAIILLVLIAMEGDY